MAKGDVPMLAAGSASLSGCSAGVGRRSEEGAEEMLEELGWLGSNRGWLDDAELMDMDRRRSLRLLCRLGCMPS